MTPLTFDLNRVGGSFYLAVPVHCHHPGTRTTNIMKINVCFLFQRAMEDIGLKSDEICDIFKIVSSVLKLGNLQFVPTTNMDGTEGCSIANEYGELLLLMMMMMMTLTMSSMVSCCSNT